MSDNNGNTNQTINTTNNVHENKNPLKGLFSWIPNIGKKKENNSPPSSISQLPTPPTQYDKLCKIFFLGNKSVGKTSVILRYMENDFSDSPRPIKADDYRMKITQVGDKKD